MFARFTLNAISRPIACRRFNAIDNFSGNISISVAIFQALAVKFKTDKNFDIKTDMNQMQMHKFNVINWLHVQLMPIDFLMLQLNVASGSHLLNKYIKKLFDSNTKTILFVLSIQFIVSLITIKCSIRNFEFDLVSDCILSAA